MEETDQIVRSVKKYKRPVIEDLSTEATAIWKSKTAWADLVRQSTQSNALPGGDLYMGDDEEDENDGEIESLLKNYMNHDTAAPGPGKVVVDIPVEECKKLWRPWRRALIVKPLGRTISFRVLSQRLTDLWALNRRIDIIDLEDGFYVVRFYAKEDYAHVLKDGPWTIQGHYLTVAKFRPGFLPSAAKVLSTLVWVRISRLPLEFFNESVLMRIGDQLGTAMKVDGNTTAVSRGKYARVCVEVDLQKPLISMVIVNGYQLNVEYENLHQICFKCGKYGHRLEVCPSGNDEVSGEDPLHLRSPSIPANPPDPFGPWMIARNNNRRRSIISRDSNEAPKMKETANVRRTQFGDAPSSSVLHDGNGRGSRFTLLSEEDDGESHTMLPELLASNLEQIPDLGPIPTFRTASKSFTAKPKERKAKGVSIKDHTKVRVNIPRPAATATSSGNTSRQPAMPHENRRPVLREPITILQRPLNDITNVTSLEDTMMRGDCEELQTHHANCTQPPPLPKGEHIKQHPPDAGKNVVMDTDVLELVDKGQTSMIDVDTSMNEPGEGPLC